jgi:hypothetical protein
MSSPAAVAVINKAGVPGDRQRVEATLTLPTAYATNGFDVSAAGGLFPSLTFSVDSVACSSATSGGKPVYFDFANKKIKVFSAIGTEVSNGTDLSAEKLDVVAFGY